MRALSSADRVADFEFTVELYGWRKANKDWYNNIQSVEVQGFGYFVCELKRKNK